MSGASRHSQRRDTTSGVRGSSSTSLSLDGKATRGVASSLLLSLEEQKDQSVMTGVDHALLSQFTEQEVRDLRMVFNMFDKERRGYIDAFELRRALRVLGFKLSHSEIDEAIADLGGKIGEVHFKDFVDIVAYRQGDSHDIYSEIHHGFDLMDYGKKERLTSDDLKMVAKEVGVKVSERMLREMIEEASTSGDNAINRDEFVAIMLQTNLYSE